MRMLCRACAGAWTLSAGTNRPPPLPKAPRPSRGKFGGEFGAAIIVGVLLGIGIDYFVHTSPWGVIIGAGLGFVAGVVNIVRVAQQYNRANPPDPNAKSIPDDDD